MNKTANVRANNGDWISVKSFSFPQSTTQKLTIVYDKPQLEGKRRGNRSIMALSESEVTLVSQSTISFYSRAASTSLSNSKAKLLPSRNHSRSESMSSCVPKDNSEIKPSVLNKELLAGRLIEKKPLHRKNLVKFYKQRINSSLIKEQYFFRNQVSGYKPKNKHNYLALSKLKLHTWIPQPIFSDPFDLSKP
jgi:hypothetical protein